MWLFCNFLLLLFQVSPSTSFMVSGTAAKLPKGHLHANTSPHCRPRPPFTKAPLTTVTWKQAAALDTNWCRPGECCQSIYTHFGSLVELAAKCCDVGGLERSPGFKGRRGKKTPHTSYLWLGGWLTWWLDTVTEPLSGPCVCFNLSVCT